MTAVYKPFLRFICTTVEMYSGGIDSIPAFFILSLVGVLVVIIATRQKSSSLNFWILTAIYFAFLISIVLFPLPVTKEAIEYGRWRTQQGLGPVNNFKVFSMIRSTWGTSAFFRQVGGNVVLFFPLGVFANWRLPHGNWKLQTVLIAIVVALTEFMQVCATLAFGFRFRSFDIDDVWLNLLGGLLGLWSMKITMIIFPGFRIWLQRHRLTVLAKEKELQTPTRESL